MVRNDWASERVRVPCPGRRRALLIVVLVSVLMPCIPLLFVSRVLASLWVGVAIVLAVIAVERLAAASHRALRDLYARRGEHPDRRGLDRWR